MSGLGAILTAGAGMTSMTLLFALLWPLFRSHEVSSNPLCVCLAEVSSLAYTSLCSPQLVSSLPGLVGNFVLGSASIELGIVFVRLCISYHVWICVESSACRRATVLAQLPGFLFSTWDSHTRSEICLTGSCPFTVVFAWSHSG